MIAYRDVGNAGGAATTHPARLGDALDDPPRLGIGEGEACGAVRQAEGLANLALRQRRVADHEIGMDASDRGRDAPRRAHFAPGLGKPQAERLGGRRLSAGIAVHD